ncbi:hypothetical protein DQ04_08931000 [Trypanosoma grayi]|uniref:hypothetical protein n=1 Tax=Trypanosoma grayi TaxID=71804 RepID=UPI0004F4B897|nr:hypothetical protein DQ04_08931000 [Trypanosoma grayi]KEG07739.1 hypothetical protein DQ04_08931000 [Trypanosoma grayi]
MMATVRRVVCLLAAALCCTALCVTAAAEATGASPPGGTSPATSGPAQAESTTDQTDVEAAKKKADAVRAKDALGNMTAAVERVIKVADYALQVVVSEVAMPALAISYYALVNLSEVVPPSKESKMGVPVKPEADSSATDANFVTSVRDAASKEKIAQAAASAAKAKALFALLGDAPTKAVTSAKNAEQHVRDTLQSTTAAAGEAFTALTKAVEIVAKSSAVAEECRTEVDKIAKLMESVSGAVDAAANLTSSVSDFANATAAASSATNTEASKDIETLKALRNDFVPVADLVHDTLEKSVEVTISAARMLNRTRKLLGVAKGLTLDTEDAVQTTIAAKAAAEGLLKKAEAVLPQVEKKLEETVKKVDEGQFATAVNEVRERSSGADGGLKLPIPAPRETPAAVTEALETEMKATDAEKLIAGVDGSDIPAWVRAPLMLLLLLACVAVW